MRTVTDRELLAWLARALTPGREREIADQVYASPELQERARSLRSALEVERGTRPAGWRVPPPGISPPRARLELSAGAEAFAGDRVPPGGRFTVRLSAVEQPEARIVMLLRREGPGWRVLSPDRADAALPLASLPLEADGSRILELIAPVTPGEQRYAVVLPLASAPAWDAGEDERWATVHAGISAGLVPVASVRVIVGEPDGG